MVSFEILKTKSYYISITCFFKGRMLWNDISCIACVVISMQPPPDSEILRFCFGQKIKVNFMGSVVFQRLKKLNVFFFSELIFN